KGKLKFPEAQSLECLRTQSRSLLSAAPTIPSRNLAWHLPHPDGAAWKNATDATAREHWLKYPRSVFAFHPCGSGIHSLNAGALLSSVPVSPTTLQAVGRYHRAGLWQFASVRPLVPQSTYGSDQRALLPRAGDL